MGIYKTGVWSEGSIYERTLPEGYTELEYIESTGTQYIDTGYTANINTEVRMVFLLNNKDTFGLYGGQVNGSDTSLRFFAASGSIYIAHGGERVQQNNNLAINTKYSLIHKKSFCTINNVSYSSSGGTNFADTTLTIGKCNGFDISYLLNGRIYSFQISENNILIRNMIPAQRNSDSVLGMYDTVNNVFYTNSGTGVFKSLAVSTDCVRLEYVQSDGTQYIDTGIKGNAKHYYKIAWLKEGVSRQLMGYNGSSKEYWGLRNKSTGQLEVGGNVYYTPTIDITQQQEYRWEYNYDTTVDNLYFNNELVITNTANPSVANTSAKFLNISASTNSYTCNVKIYSYIIKDWNDNILAYYIPAKRNSDNKIGLFEAVSQTFKLSGNDNQFIAGPVYTESDNVKIYQEENIIEANSFIEI